MQDGGLGVLTRLSYSPEQVKHQEQEGPAALRTRRASLLRRSCGKYCLKIMETVAMTDRIRIEGLSVDDWLRVHQKRFGAYLVMGDVLMDGNHLIAKAILGRGCRSPLTRIESELAHLRNEEAVHVKARRAGEDYER